MKITIILGTARDERQTENVANLYKRYLDMKGILYNFFDVREFQFGHTVAPWQAKESEFNDQIVSYRESVLESDVLIVITPEYNRMFPGELKIFMDSLYREYAGKKVVLVGTSSGIFGGARVVEILRIYVTYLEMDIRGVGTFGNVDSSFENGELTDGTKDKYEKMVGKSLLKVI